MGQNKTSSQILHSACGKPKRDDFCKTLFRNWFLENNTKRDDFSSSLYLPGSMLIYRRVSWTKAMVQIRPWLRWWSPGCVSHTAGSVPPPNSGNKTWNGDIFGRLKGRGYIGHVGIVVWVKYGDVFCSSYMLLYVHIMWYHLISLAFVGGRSQHKLEIVVSFRSQSCFLETMFTQQPKASDFCPTVKGTHQREIDVVYSYSMFVFFHQGTVV